MSREDERMREIERKGEVGRERKYVYMYVFEREENRVRGSGYDREKVKKK